METACKHRNIESACNSRIRPVHVPRQLHCQSVCGRKFYKTWQTVNRLYVRCWSAERAKVVFVPCGSTFKTLSGMCRQMFRVCQQKCAVCRASIDIVIPLFNKFYRHTFDVLHICVLWTYMILQCGFKTVKACREPMFVLCNVFHKIYIKSYN